MLQTIVLVGFIE